MIAGLNRMSSNSSIFGEVHYGRMVATFGDPYDIVKQVVGHFEYKVGMMPSSMDYDYITRNNSYRGLKTVLVIIEVDKIKPSPMPDIPKRVLSKLDECSQGEQNNTLLLLN